MIDDAVGLVGGALDAIAAVSPWLLGLAVALHLLKVVAEARAWHRIVAYAEHPSEVRFRTTLAAFVGSIGANAFLPARVGEAFRVAVVRRRVPGSSVPTIAATIVLESLLELAFAAAVLAALFLGGRSTPFGLSPTRLASQPPLVGALAALVVVAGAVAVLFRRWAADLARRLARGFAVLGSARTFGAVCGWKLTAWTLRIASVLVFLLAFHLHATPWTALVVIGAQSVAGLVPVLPGNAGTQQAAFAVVLAGAGSAATILGFGVGMQASTLVADVAVGAVAAALLAGSADPRRALPALRARRLARATTG